MTSTEYRQYQQAVESFFGREEIENLSSTSEEPYFSWRPCDCCQRDLGGNRYDASGYNRKAKEVQEYSVCEDCIYYAEYGQLDDQTMMDIEKSDK